MNYPINLIRAYKAHEISRAEFCRRYAALQGFDDTVKGSGDYNGIYLEYRGRKAKIDGALLVWQENGQQYTARSFKELKIRIDMLEIKAAA